MHAILLGAEAMNAANRLSRHVQLHISDHLSINRSSMTHLASGLVDLSPRSHDEGIIDRDAGNHFCAGLGELVIVIQVARQVSLQVTQCTVT